MPHAPLQTFIIYARADEAHKNELLRHLNASLVESGDLRVWQDGNLLPGEDWEKSIKSYLEQSRLVLMLVSVDALDSAFIKRQELRMALEQHTAGRTTVVPIVLRPCGWKYHPALRGLQGLPKNMKPVTSHANPEEAWMDVLEGLERILLKIREGNEPPKEKLPAPPPPLAENPAEEAAWKMAARLDVEAAYQHYLEDFPKGKYVAEAKKRMAVRTAKVITPKLEIPEPQPLIRDCPDCPEMVFVKGGTFMMGSEDGEDNEKPIHQVILSDYYIGKYPVTFEEYDRFCEEAKRKKLNDFGWGRGKRPIIGVSWDNANAYSDWLSEKTQKDYRLPTEAEWEFAARGGIKSKGRKFSGRNDWEKLNISWFQQNFGNNAKTHIVTEKTANEIGLHDMSGNVWEWCNDWYGDYPRNEQKNPKGPKKGVFRVRRGGSNICESKYCRVASRGGSEPEKQHSDLGFRLACSL